MANDHITGHVIVTDEVGAVELFWRNFVAKGDAKKHPKDDSNESIAALLAMARALEDLSDQVYAAAAGEIAEAAALQEQWDAYLAEETF